MFSAFTQRLQVLPKILRQNVYSHTQRVASTPAFHSRLLFSTPLTNFESPLQSPEMKRDPSWKGLTAYTDSRLGESSSEDIWRAMSERHLRIGPATVYAGSLLSRSLVLSMRLNHSSTGRSVPVRNGDISRAMASLSLRLRANKVVKTWKYQMRHEKKGVKRRRLKSERWRRRFADEVCRSSLGGCF